MVEYTDIFVGSPMEDVKEAVQQVFQKNDFKVQWSGEYDGKASRGSKGKQLAFGGFSPYHEIEFKILTGPDETVSVRLIKRGGGWSGGLLGKRKVKKQYEKVVQMVADHFSSIGTYKGRK